MVLPESTVLLLLLLLLFYLLPQSIVLLFRQVAVDFGCYLLSSELLLVYHFYCLLVVLSEIRFLKMVLIF